MVVQGRRCCGRGVRLESPSASLDRLDGATILTSMGRQFHDPADPWLDFDASILCCGSSRCCGSPSAAASGKGSPRRGRPTGVRSRFPAVQRVAKATRPPSRTRPRRPTATSAAASTAAFEAKFHHRPGSRPSIGSASTEPSRFHRERRKPLASWSPPTPIHPRSTQARPRACRWMPRFDFRSSSGSRVPAEGSPRDRAGAGSPRMFRDVSVTVNAMRPAR